jgi:photosystem II stability/assembly factor-like uncharacterized protein
MLRRITTVLAGIVFLAAGVELVSGQSIDPGRFHGLRWRNVGPFRGGRATAVAGVAGQPRTFFMGTAGGGVWKTVDSGLIWENVSDGFLKTSSVGAIAVAVSDPNVVYVGMGEACVRDVTTTHGDGVYKSTDAGKTWTHLGLETTRHIAEVRVHPRNPDLVYVAAQGNPWARNPERGVYRSKDGGASWERILGGNDLTGANDLSMDPTNPRVLYAAMWEHWRRPWHGYQMMSGGEGSGLFKSIDGGDHWVELTGKGGLPAETGKIGVSVSPADPNRIYALVEAEEGGLYRSDDAGESWMRVNGDHVLTERVAYYAHVFADPRERETVYVLNAPFLKSTDGGRSFDRIRPRHGDNHDLWIHPENNQWMISANDGGAHASYDGGRTWSTLDNQPTAQFYRVITDNLFPYHLYGGQQDNTTVRIASRSMGPGISEQDWHPVGGGESAHVAFDPDDPRFIYAGNYQGQITEYDEKTGLSRSIAYQPRRTAFRLVKDYPIRFNWNAPILVSQHDRRLLYHAGSVLLRSSDRGRSWEEVSLDLTRPDPEHLGKVEGRFTTDGTAGAAYHTIFYVAESPHEPGTLYAGTDDGFVHLTRDGGRSWKDVSPRDMESGQINSIEVSPHDPATAYLAVTRYKYGDFAPLVLATSDYGASWKRIVEGIAPEAWARVVREDPSRKGLLYLGTEAGLYVSFDGGARWQSFQLNLPIVPITDLRVHRGDLVAATQGRAFWILDDVTPLHQMNAGEAVAGGRLFAPRVAYRLNGEREFGGRSPYKDEGENPPNGALLYYWLGGSPEELRLEILDAENQALRTFTPSGSEKLPSEAGLNRLVWDLRVEDLRVPEKDLDTYFGSRAYRVGPGTYKVRLTAGGNVRVEELQVASDPRLGDSAEDYRELQEFTAVVYRTVEELYESIHRARDARKQLDGLRAAAGEGELAEAAARLVDRLETWEDALVQTRQEFPQEQPDALHQPYRLDFNLIWIMTAADRMGPPLNEGPRRRLSELEDEWTATENELSEIWRDIERFNVAMAGKSLPSIRIPPPSFGRGLGPSRRW